MKYFLLSCAVCFVVLSSCNKTPEQVYVNSITITEYPTTDSQGTPWDTDGPDLYLELQGNAWSYTPIKENETQETVVWYLEEPLLLSVEPSTAFVVSLREDDPGENPASQLIGSATWYTADDKTVAPASITVVGNTITCVIGVEWI